MEKIEIRRVESASIHFDSGTFESSIQFNTGPGVEVLRLAENGDIFVRGNLVENDKQVVAAFKEWLALATSKAPPGAP